MKRRSPASMNPVPGEGDTRERVMAAAIRAFAAAGYAGTSVQDILAATGLSKPTLYYYFGSKEGLFRALINFAHDESHRRITAATTGPGTCAQRLVELTAALFEFAQGRQDLMRLVFASTFAAPAEIPPGVIETERRRRNFAEVERLVRTGQAAGELTSTVAAAELTHAFFGAISHRVRMHLLQAEGPLDRRRAEQVVDLFLNGARPSVARPGPVNSASPNSHASPSRVPPAARPRRLVRRPRRVPPAR